MKPLHRILLATAAALFSAAGLPAQHAASGGHCPPRIGGGYGGNYSYGGGGSYAYASPYNGLGGSLGFDTFGGWGFADFGPIHHPQEHEPFGVVMAHGDADFQPSQYMDYNEALELGKKILAEQAAPQPSLGDIARNLRAKRRVSQTQSKPELLVVTQDNHGKAPVCSNASDTCRPTT